MPKVNKFVFLKKIDNRTYYIDFKNVSILYFQNLIARLTPNFSNEVNKK